LAEQITEAIAVSALREIVLACAGAGLSVTALERASHNSVQPNQ
jgi:hypothetical protein